MGKKDTITKEFLSANERFADLFNFYLFDGRQVIQPNDLEERNASELFSLGEKGKKEKRQEVFRDLLKSAVVKSADDVFFVLLGIENQSEIHYAMPIKNMAYDVANYEAQVKEIARKHHSKNELAHGAEFLSGLKKTDKLTPVITLTVYWGADEWDTPLSLHEMLNVKNSELLKYVADYKINLLIPSRIEDFGKFNTSVGEVLEVVKLSRNREKMGKLIYSNPRFRNLEKDAVSMISEVVDIKVPVNEKEETVDMCKAWEDQRLEGLEQGLKEYSKAIRLLKKDGCDTVEKLMERGVSQKTAECVIEDNLALK